MAAKTVCSHSEHLVDTAGNGSYGHIAVRMEIRKENFETERRFATMTGFNALALLSARIIIPSSLAD